jgi:hypothetical protein
MAEPLAVGAPAPDLVYRTPEGEPRRLADLWARGPALLLWPRHCG